MNLLETNFLMQIRVRECCANCRFFRSIHYKRGGVHLGNCQRFTELADKAMNDQYSVNEIFVSEEMYCEHYERDEYYNNQTLQYLTDEKEYAMFPLIFEEIDEDAIGDQLIHIHDEHLSRVGDIDSQELSWGMDEIIKLAENLPRRN